MNTKDILDLTSVKEDESWENRYSFSLMCHVYIC